MNDLSRNKKIKYLDEIKTRNITEMVVSNTNCSKNETLLWHIFYSKTTDANVNLGSGLSSDTDIEMWGNYTANWDAQIVLK